MATIINTTDTTNSAPLWPGGQVHSITGIQLPAMKVDLPRVSEFTVYTAAILDSPCQYNCQPSLDHPAMHTQEQSYENASAKDTLGTAKQLRLNEK